jgi:hypothetical protein
MNRAPACVLAPALMLIMSCNLKSLPTADGGSSVDGGGRGTGGTTYDAVSSGMDGALANTGGRGGTGGGTGGTSGSTAGAGGTLVSTGGILGKTGGTGGGVSGMGGQITATGGTAGAVGTGGGANTGGIFATGGVTRSGGAGGLGDGAGGVVSSGGVESTGGVVGTGGATSNPDASLGGNGGNDAASDQPSACNAGASCTSSSGGDPCGVFQIDCSSGSPACIRVGNQKPGTICSSGVCSLDGTCVACVLGDECTQSSDPCIIGELDCGLGTPVCTAGSTARPDGWLCGTNRVCSAGACVVCVANQACTPSAGACMLGQTSCATGASVCQPTIPAAAGMPCGSAKVCDGKGTCVDCREAAACTPASLCHVGALACGGGSPTCTDTNQSLADNVLCSVGKLCSAGNCVDAGSWITRGEDGRTLTGGTVWTYQGDGATITPATSETSPFVPSPGGRSGNALAVSGTIPPRSSTATPVSGLGFNFLDKNVSINGAARGEGFQFYAKSATAGTLQVQVLDIWTDAAYPNCSTSRTASVVNRCYNFPMSTCTLQADTWTLCRFLWTDLRRADWGNQGAGLPLDANVITGIQINVPPTPQGSPTQAFQFAVDDVSFLPAASACTSPLMIDDMEDGDGLVCRNSAYSGGWFVIVSPDGGTTSPLPNTVVLPEAIPSGGRSGSLKAIHFSGTGLGSVPEYAIVGVSLNGSGVPYDAAYHRGVTLWARSASGSLKVRMNMVTMETLPEELGGSCVYDGYDSCYDHFGAFLTLTPTWQQYTIGFQGGLAQEGWGVVATLDLAHLLSIDFLMDRHPVRTPNNPADFEYWIDDVQFFD